MIGKIRSALAKKKSKREEERLNFGFDAKKSRKKTEETIRRKGTSPFLRTKGTPHTDAPTQFHGGKGPGG